jgi:hypothetical protein
MSGRLTFTTFLETLELSESASLAVLQLSLYAVLPCGWQIESQFCGYRVSTKRDNVESSDDEDKENTRPRKQVQSAV